MGIGAVSRKSIKPHDPISRYDCLLPKFSSHISPGMVLLCAMARELLGGHSRGRLWHEDGTCDQGRPQVEPILSDRQKHFPCDGARSILFFGKRSPSNPIFRAAF